MEFRPGQFHKSVTENGDQETLWEQEGRDVSMVTRRLLLQLSDAVRPL